MLTPEEQAELSAIQAMKGNPSRGPSQFPVSNLLTPEESEELAAIQAMRGVEGGNTQSSVNQPAPQSSLGDQLQTQLENFGNTVSMGYLPQIQAGFEKYLSPNPTKEIDEQLGIQEPSYVQMRDQNINRQQSQNERNPESALFGTLGGVAVQAPLIAKTAVQAGTGLMSRLAGGAGTGFGLGAVSNPGDIAGQVSPLQGEERLSNAALGGVFGVVGQGLGEGVAKTGRAIRNAPETLERAANTTAFKATGAVLKDFRKAFGNNTPNEVGKTLLAKNLIQAGDSLEDIAIKTSGAKQEAGQTIRKVYDQVNKFIKDYTDDAIEGRKFTSREKALLDSTKLNGTKIAGEARVAVIKAFKNNPGNTEAKNKVLSALDDVAAMGDDIDLADLIESRQGIDTQISYSKQAKELPIVQQQLKTLRDSLHKAIQQRVRAIGVVVKDKKLIETLRTANKEYGQLSTAESAANGRIFRENSNRFFTLGDRIGSLTGGTIGALSGDSPEERVKNGLIGVATGFATEKYGRYSLPVVSRIAKSMGEALKKPAAFAKFGEPLIEAAKRSPQEFQALINQFGKDPEFVKLAAPIGAR